MEGTQRAASGWATARGKAPGRPHHHTAALPLPALPLPALPCSPKT